MTNTLKSLLAALTVVGLTTACGSLATSDPGELAWDVERSEKLTWTAADTRFGADRAVEVSGMCLTPSGLVLSSEKFPLLLEIDLSGNNPPRVLDLDLPEGAEIEGLAWSDGALYLCDEANAAVYRVNDLPSTGSSDEGHAPLAVERLEIQGVVIRGGKSGLEGIAVSPNATSLYLIHERERDETGCHSTLYRFRLEGDRLIPAGDPVSFALEDCSWRLSDLSWYHGDLYALRTQYPGERYEVVLVDADGGSLTPVLDLTATARAAAGAGFSNNLEALAISESLYVASDNAATARAVGRHPGPAEDTTLLLLVPPASDAAPGSQTKATAP